MPEINTQEIAFQEIQPTHFPDDVIVSNTVLQSAYIVCNQIIVRAEFNVEHGFFSLTEKGFKYVEGIIEMSKKLVETYLVIESGEFGLLRIEGQDTSDEQEKVWYVLPIAFEKTQDEYVFLAGVFVYREEDTGQFYLSSQVILIRDPVITGTF